MAGWEVHGIFHRHFTAGLFRENSPLNTKACWQQQIKPSLLWKGTAFPQGSLLQPGTAKDHGAIELLATIINL
jgi:hypothetical protein